jgi:hypothetical protein
MEIDVTVNLMITQFMNFCFLVLIVVVFENPNKSNKHLILPLCVTIIDVYVLGPCEPN